MNGYNMLEDQKHILEQISGVIDAEAPDAVVIAGDVFDKPAPPAEAVDLLDRFLVGLSEKGFQVFVIPGNHDCAERLAFGSRLMTASGVHICPARIRSEQGSPISPYRLKDRYGAVNIYMLPFLKPADLRACRPGENIRSYTDALRAGVGLMDIDEGERNVLVAHQFVTGSTRSDSEDVCAGGTDNVDACVFEKFDYTALGHLHCPQYAGSGRIRYCGSPLKYSFSEAGRAKSVTVAELGVKGDLTVREVPLTPGRDLREIRGRYEELVSKRFYEGTATDDYLHITLTDEEDVIDGAAKLRTIYPNLMKLDYDNARTRSGGAETAARDMENKTPLQLFSEFYEAQNGQPLSEEQRALCEEMIGRIWEEQL